MKFYQETTEWAGSTPNHIYLLNDSKDRALGYVKSGTDDLIVFKSPLNFNTRRRTFKQVRNRWGFKDNTVKPVESWQVKGSKGDTYTVSREDGRFSCTCAGHKFRGYCKHVEQISEKV